MTTQNTLNRHIFSPVAGHLAVGPPQARPRDADHRRRGDGRGRRVREPEAEDFPEFRSLLLDSETITADFVAMKMGDMNLDRNVDVGRSGDALVMNISDQPYEIGQQVTLTPFFEKAVLLRGLQFELHFDAGKLQFEGVQYFEELPMTAENFGLRLVEDGVIYCSWTSENLLDIRNQLPLFSFVFKAKESGVASESVALVGDRLSAEVYPNVYVNQPLALRFGETSNSIEMGQNIPNPFRDVTRIPMEFEKPETVHLLVTDLQGKVILQRKIEGLVGKQEIEISSRDINAPGLYYYSIIGSDFKETRKMILLR